MGVRIGVLLASIAVLSGCVDRFLEAHREEASRPADLMIPEFQYGSWALYRVDGTDREVNISYAHQRILDRDGSWSWGLVVHAGGVRAFSGDQEVWYGPNETSLWFGRGIPGPPLTEIERFADVLRPLSNSHFWVTPSESVAGLVRIEGKELTLYTPSGGTVMAGAVYSGDSPFPAAVALPHLERIAWGPSGKSTDTCYWGPSPGFGLASRVLFDEMGIHPTDGLFNMSDIASRFLADANLTRLANFQARYNATEVVGFRYSRDGNNNSWRIFNITFGDPATREAVGVACLENRACEDAEFLRLTTPPNVWTDAHPGPGAVLEPSDAVNRYEHVFDTPASTLTYYLGWGYRYDYGWGITLSGDNGTLALNGASGQISHLEGSPPEKSFEPQPIIMIGEGRPPPSSRP